MNISYSQVIPSCGTNEPLGANLICNGDFELGDVCFTTQYTKHSTAPDVSCGSCFRDWSNPNEYEVVTNVVTQFHTGFTSTPTDHTPTGTNHFMAVDGACNVGQKVWQQTVNVTSSNSPTASPSTRRNKPPAGNGFGSVTVNMVFPSNVMI